MQDMAAAAAGSSAWVDVRDLALAHILALQKEDAGGKRLLVCAGPYILQDFSANLFHTSHLKVDKPYSRCRA
jgi:nucleoside-diphosphate-sugar epimerase